MPYFVTDESPDCSGWAVVKEDGEVIGCHTSKAAAQAQMVAISLGEGIEPGGSYSVTRADAPAPEGDQITGSDTNEPGSAKGKLGDIDLTEAQETALQNKSDDHNKEMADGDRPVWTRVRVDALRAVYRRGAGAYSVSHRPGTTRNQWAMARVNAFLHLARTGSPENSAYVGDNDLLHPEHPRYSDPERALRVLPDNYRPALSPDVPEGRACGNCVFYNEAKIEGDKAYCEKWDDYVSGAYYCNAWQPDDGGEEDDQVRVLIDVPQYIQEAAEKGLTYERNGFAGDGLTEQTVEEARQLRAGQVEDDKVTRMRAWILRHRGDWEGVPRNSNSDDPDFPGPGAVAAYLWGVDPTAENGADRVLEWADGVLAPLTEEERFDVKELETRALPMGDFTVREDEDGQKTFTGYAALFGAPSAGLPFTEVIAPGAFRRTLSRVADGKKIVSFLFGHDETRALATTASGRLTLTEDERGLKVEARLDPADPDAAGVISKLTHEALAMGMSFGFTIPKNGDEWNEDERTLREVNLFEVSVLSAGQTPAYPATLGLTSVRKVASKMGVDGDRLISAIESLKSAQPLTEEDVEVIETVTEKLAPKRTVLDPSIARAKLLLAEMESESL